MGKICRQLKNLKDEPQYWQQTLKLIEESFKYRPPFHFENDFVTLMNKDNAHHLFILVENEKVIAHLGVKIRNITLQEELLPIAMLGGIAVDSHYRGQGLLSFMMNEIKEAFNNDVCAFILWSDLISLYEKYGFFLCGPQYPLSRKSEKNTYHLLTNATEAEKNQIKILHHHYFKKHYAFIERTQLDWEQLFNSKSCEIWVNDPNNLTSYFIKNKGQDLQNIIHEYATSENRTEFLKTISHWGEVWMTQDYFHEDIAHFQFMLAAGQKFSNLVKAITKGRIKLSAINQNECHFNFKGTDYVMNSSEFFSGIFGPARFSELKDNRDLFIAGWDSI